MGDGAPPAVVSAFQTALARKQVTVEVPAVAPASRASNGYIQTVQAEPGAAAATYSLVAQPDQPGSALLLEARC